jgi:sRNA-binding protein
MDSVWHNSHVHVQADSTRVDDGGAVCGAATAGDAMEEDADSSTTHTANASEGKRRKQSKTATKKKSGGEVGDC